MEYARKDKSVSEEQMAAILAAYKRQKEAETFAARKRILEEAQAAKASLRGLPWRRIPARDVPKECFSSVRLGNPARRPSRALPARRLFTFW
jgi:hypothetical protein